MSCLISNRDIIEYFINKTNMFKTFEIKSWVDESYEPHLKRAGRMFNNVNPEGVLPQSLYFGRSRTGVPILFMGLLGGDKGTDDIEIDIAYYYETQEMHLDYNNVSMHKEHKIEDCMDCFLFEFGSEEEYFQSSLIEEKYFTFEKEQEMKRFFDDILTVLLERKLYA